MNNNQFFSREIEMSVIGQLMNYPDQFWNLEQIEEADFFIPEHKILFKITRDILIKNKTISLCLIFDQAKREEIPINISYITELSQMSSIEEDLSCYIRALKEKSACRKLFQLFNTAIQKFLKTTCSPDKILTKIQKDLDNINYNFQLDQSDNSTGAIKNIIYPSNTGCVLNKIEGSFKFKEMFDKDYECFIKTGFMSLDQKTSILENKNFVVIAARPSVGKTALALNMALNIAKHDYAVGFFSLEMSKDHILDRFISLLSKKSCEDIKRGKISKQDLDNIKTIVPKLSEMPIYIADSNYSSFKQMCIKAKIWKRHQNIGILFIDYLQLLSPDHERENRQTEIAEFSRSLKRLSNELNIPIVCLSQLSRKVEDRGDKKPLISDIRDSGQVEQDADVVILLNKRTKINQHEPSNEDVIELHIGKHRHGPTFSTLLKFEKYYGGFSDFVFEW